MLLTPENGRPRSGASGVAHTSSLRRFSTCTLASPVAKPSSQRSSSGLDHQPAVWPGLDRQELLEVGGRGPQIVVEARDDPLLGHRPDHHGEQAQDPEGQRGAAHGELQLDRQAGPHADRTT